MRVAAVGRPERSMGDAVIPAEPPRWSEVRAHAAELAAGPVHLEVLATLVRAALALDGLGGLQRALADMADVFEQHWADIFPEPDEDDPDEPWYARSNLLVDLAAAPDFRDALLRTPLVSVRGVGTFSVRDLDIAAGSIEGSEEERARCQGGIIDGAFAEAPAEALAATAEALDGALDACRRIGEVLGREIDAGAASALAPIAERLGTLRTRFRERAGTRLATAGDTDAANDGAGGAAEAGATAGAPVDVANAAGAASASGASAGETGSALADHAAVRTALDGVIRYYVRHEPGSPVAVLAARTRELVGRGFFELVGTLCPETEYGTDLATRLGAPRRDPLLTLLAEGFGNHLAGSEPFDPSAYADDGGDDAHGSVDPDITHADDIAVDRQDPAAGEIAADEGAAAADASVATRADVLRTLDEVLAFYRAHEPSSPVPLVLARMRTLVPLDFDGVLDALRKALAADSAPADAADA